jgi:hypothetical protein
MNNRIKVCTIAEAAAVLDIEKPGWEKRINVDILQMHCGHRCILGQLYGSEVKNTFWNGFDRGIDTLMYKYRLNGQFNSDASKEEWIREIDARLNAIEKVEQPELELV